MSFKSKILLLVLLNGIRFYCQDSDVLNNKKQVHERAVKRFCEKLNMYAHSKTLYEIIPGVAKEFLGVQYENAQVDKTQKINTSLQTMNNFSFVVNTIALSIITQEDNCNYKSFKNTLEMLYYRNGTIEGYSSKLHYFSDWALEQTVNNILVERTRNFDGIPIRFTINYITKRAGSNPALENKEELKLMKNIEQKLSSLVFYHIPRNKFNKNSLKNIRTGDLIAFSAIDRDGIDVHHIGFAWRIGKEIHLIHASSHPLEKQVIISKKTVYDYFAEHHKFVGIRVFSWIR
jgi:hypothetical protein